MPAKEPPAPVRPIRRLRALMRVLALLFLLAAVAYLVGPFFAPDVFRELPFVSNSVVKVGLLMLLCLYVAGDPARRRGLVPVVVAAHAVSLAAMLLVLVAGDTGTPLGGSGPPLRDALLGALALDGVILLILLAVWLPARAALAAAPAGPPARWIPAPEKWLARVLFVLAGLFALATAGYAAGPLLEPTRGFFREVPFVTNSAVKVAALAMAAGFAAARIRERLAVVGPVIAAHVLSLVAQGVYLLFLDTSAVVSVAGAEMAMTDVLLGAIALDGAIALLLFVLYQASWRGRLRNRFFSPTEMRTLVSLTEVMMHGERPAIPPLRTARNVDRALADMRFERRGTFRLALRAIHFLPLASLRPPLAELDPDERFRFVHRRFYKEPRDPRMLDLVRAPVQAFMRIGHQLTNLGHYDDPAVHPTIGYTRFSRRPRAEAAGAAPRDPLGLAVDRPWDLDGGVIETDVCVIGSGAGGAIAAYALAEALDGRRVTVLERGRYVEPRHFSESDLDQLGALYDRGILQVAHDFRFSLLQGSCLGGSTTVNNAICFAPPDDVLAAWNDPAGRHAALDLADVRAAMRWAEEFLAVKPLEREHHPGLSHHAAWSTVDAVLRDAERRRGIGLARPRAFDTNMAGCLGCGYCNNGCAYGRKLSMLDHTLPLAQQRFGRDRVHIVAECEVDRLVTRSGRPRRIEEAEARLSDGRRVRIRARAFVLAGGAMASSHLLLASGVGRGLPVGRGLAFNMFSPVFAEVRDPVNAYDGVQMGHYMTHPSDDFIVETWFSPPVGLATAMSGWFDRHFANMRRAGHLLGYGAVVGTDRNGVVRRDVTGGPAFRYTPTPADMDKMARGLDEICRTLLRADGVERVMLSTWGGDELRSEADLEKLPRLVRDPRFITLASSHPQGGNAVSADPSRGVVDPQLCVHGCANLFVTDASVFPGSVRVNPQMTVMALARYGAERIAAAFPGL